MPFEMGEKHYKAKLNADDVSMIRELVHIRNQHLEKAKYHREQAKKLTAEAIAEKFDIHEGHVRRIAGKTTWSHV